MTESRAGFVSGLLAAALVVASAGCSRAPSTPAPSASGAQMPETVTLGDAEVSVSVVPTSILSDTVAHRYGVARERNRVLVLVGLRAGDASRNATVSGRARDLRGVAQALTFREVQADGFVDYVAVAAATPPDTLRFELDVVDAAGQRATLRFSRDLAP